MKFEQLLAYISDADLEFLSAETKVNHQVKKLTGATIFKLILYSLLENNRPSLRVMEAFFNSAKFKVIANLKEESIKYNSISDRISTIKPQYFEALFNLLFKKFNKLLNEDSAIQKYDTTMVAISSKLVNWGMRVGSKTNKVQVKYTLGVHGSLPCYFKIFSSQEHLAEDRTIPEVILEYKNKTASIVVFDRGVKDRNTFKKFSDENIVFVTRVNTDANFQINKKKTIKKHDKESGVMLKEDLNINFAKRGSRKFYDTPIRLIKGNIKETGEEIYFITNNFELDPYEIAAIYKKRWEIEMFFKFLKQELNLSHLINRSPNGISVMLYMTLILSMLILVYKKTNKLAGFKIVKLKVAKELENHLIKEIVILSGGNPALVSHILGDP
jgi:hypothetical protein